MDMGREGDRCSLLHAPTAVCLSIYYYYYYYYYYCAREAATQDPWTWAGFAKTNFTRTGSTMDASENHMEMEREKGIDAPCSMY